MSNETIAEVLATELRALYRHYVNTLETARDQIISCGGDCDPLDVMKQRDPVLQRVRDVLERSLAAGKAVSREEVEQALEKAGAYRRKQTLWLVTTKEATEAVRALMKGLTAPPADPAYGSERLYNAINHLMAQIGCHGEINSKAPECAEVMDSLAEIDGGVYRSANANGSAPDGWREFLELWSSDGHLQTFEDRERFRKHAQALLATPPASAPRSSPDGEVRLWDSQWANIVNHDNCYRGWSTEDAVAHAVKMTEQLIRKNVLEKSCPPAKASAPEVTEEMVERHAQAWVSNEVLPGWWLSMTDDAKEKVRARSRIALTAALQEQSHG